MRRIQLEEIQFVMTDSGGFRVTGVDDKAVEVQVPLIDVRAAVVPPKPERPGYYLILSMLLDQSESGKHPLLFLGEHEDGIQSSLLKKLKDYAARLSVREVYADESNEGFFSNLWRQFKSVREVRVYRALHTADLDYGIALVREWLEDGALSVPKYTPTILCRQLGSMTTETLKLMTAIDPLRYLFSGFVNDPPSFLRSRSQEQVATNWYY